MLTFKVLDLLNDYLFNEEKLGLKMVISYSQLLFGERENNIVHQEGQ